MFFVSRWRDTHTRWTCKQTRGSKYIIITTKTEFNSAGRSVLEKHEEDEDDYTITVISRSILSAASA